jgi:glycine betaine/proline transport system ATP-binding protein
MQDEVARLQRELRKTCVFITHDLAEALKLGDRIAIMKDGRFVQVGTPAEVVARPADAYVRAFTRDVQRAHVLTAENLMGPPPTDGERLGPAVGTATLLSELVKRVTACADTLPVVDPEGSTVGTIDRGRVLAAIAGDEPARTVSG